MTSRPSLMEKISGPNAVPIALLVERGEAAAARVHEGFASFLEQRARDLSVMRQRITGPGDAGWQEFYATVVDLRGSAATAGRHAVAVIAGSLEAMLDEKLFDSRAVAVLNSHVDALMLVSAGEQGEGAIRHLIAELEQAVARLSPRPQTGSPGG